MPTIENPNENPQVVCGARLPRHCRALGTVYRDEIRWRSGVLCARRAPSEENEVVCHTGICCADGDVRSEQHVGCGGTITSLQSAES